MNKVDDLKRLVENVSTDMEKFYNKGNKVAGTRARKGLQELKKLAQDIRIEIQEKKNEG